MVNYKNGKIYKLFNKVNDKYYIGSTCSTLKNRKSGHKCQYKKNPNILIYKEILKIGWLDSNGKQNWFMKKIYDFSCHCKGELLKEEGKYIKLCIEKDGELVLNMKIAGRTKKEYRKENKEILKIKNKKMRQDRKEQLKINQMKYRTKPEVKQRIKFQMKKYNGEKVKCECGKIMNRLRSRVV